MGNLKGFRTKTLILNTFIGLIKEKPFSTITICHICEKAKIHRSTFYRHYDDKYELLDEVVSSFAKDLLIEIKQGQEPGKTLFEDLIEYVDNNRQLFLHVSIKNNCRDLYDRIVQKGSEILLTNSKEFNDPLSNEIRNSDYPNALCDFYSSGFCEVIKKWVTGEYVYSKQEIIMLFKKQMTRETL